MTYEADILSAHAIPGYRITGVLGVGGYTTVFRAVERRTARAVALKVLAERYCGVRRVERAMVREIDLLCELRHEGIVKGYGVVSGFERLTLSMECVPGASLAGHVSERGALDPQDAAETLFQVALALSYLHDHGIVHLDIKPGNILITPRGHTKLIDFSLARTYGPWKRLVPSWLRKSIPGTPSYMAPEQIRGGAPDPRSDLYALGTAGYRALTGRLPFEGDSLREVLHRQTSTRAAPPSRWKPGIPRALERLILGLLRKDPADRPQTADEVCRLLTPLVRSGLRAAGTRA